MSTDTILGDEALDILFREARTHKAWNGKDVTDVLVQAVYDLMKWGPTSANCCPARFVFIKSKEAKERLKPHLDAGNVDKTMSAPIVAIIAYDMDFVSKMGKLAPHMKDPSRMFGTDEAKLRETAFRNGTLEGGYFMLAARALGLDCGPMSGFNKDGVKAEFLSDTKYEPNFLCNLGYGDTAQLFPRAPRLEFDEACEIL